jgi:hypothetical protein
MSERPVHQPAAPSAEKLQYPANPRLARMRFLSRLLDNSIPLPGGYRIGLDPIIGLVPGAGDLVASAFSIWIMYDAARLGVQKRHLLRMAMNIIIETVAGSVPLIGDLFDAVWKANAKNMQIVELHYRPTTTPRPLHRILFAFVGFLVAFYLGLFGILYLAFRFLISLFGS